MISVSTNCTLCECDKRNALTQGFQRCYDPAISATRELINIKEGLRPILVTDSDVSIAREVRDTVCLE